MKNSHRHNFSLPFYFFFLAAAEFGKSLAQLEELQVQITNGLDSNKTLLKGVQDSFASNMEAIRNNMISLDERVKKLNKWSTG